MVNSLVVKASIEKIWDFFSNPNNLSVLTPKSMKLKIIKPVPPGMFIGQKTKYSVSPLFGFRFRWEGEIIDIIEGKQFIDEQRKGPFSYWRHHHIFIDQAGGTEIRDQLEYSLPFGALGSIVQPFVHKQIIHMFDYRNKKIKEIFK